MKDRPLEGFSRAQLEGFVGMLLDFDRNDLLMTSDRAKRRERELTEIASNGDIAHTRRKEAAESAMVFREQTLVYRQIAQEMKDQGAERVGDLDESVLWQLLGATSA